jgi:hypothetical protein
MAFTEIGMIQFGRRTVVVAGLWLAAAVPATAQGPEEARRCWLSYANCTGASFGDEIWRSICYADYSGCLATAPLPACPEDGIALACAKFLTDCRELSGGDQKLLDQCAADVDACRFAHGC